MIFLSTINSLKTYGYETVESLQSKHPCWEAQFTAFLAYVFYCPNAPFQQLELALY
jgi:hypothetical protein